MRHLTDYSNSDTDQLLEKLINKNTSIEEYREAMYKLGNQLAVALQPKISSSNFDLLYIACTVEDADFLAKGLIDSFHHLGIPDKKIKLACFWNKRLNPFDIDNYGLDIAPIVKEYSEPANGKPILIVVKSIISGACVVKTNLSVLMERISPLHVWIVAPVMYKDAQQNLEKEFPNKSINNFKYLTFAIDNQKSPDGNEIVPGIGGVVYDRLGLGGSTLKNPYVPSIVKLRRTHIS